VNAVLLDGGEFQDVAVPCHCWLLLVEGLMTWDGLLPVWVVKIRQAPLGADPVMLADKVRELLYLWPGHTVTGILWLYMSGDGRDTATAEMIGEKEG
jgi:hypothetical protein